ncbi:unnamed protein product [Amoebophrya sp. A25]|nr:unnamed protein product [Amoebophrya sp. A25]|eukprot:GSA25T00023885001.1
MTSTTVLMPSGLREPCRERVAALLLQLASEKNLERDAAVMRLSPLLGQQELYTHAVDRFPTAAWAERVGLLQLIAGVENTAGHSGQNTDSVDHKPNVGTLLSVLESSALRDPELRVRRALAPAVERLFHEAHLVAEVEGNSSTTSSDPSCTSNSTDSPSAEAFLEAVLSDVLLGFERKLNPIVPNAADAGSRGVGGNRAQLAPSHLVGTSAQLLKKTMDNAGTTASASSSRAIILGPLGRMGSPFGDDLLADDALEVEPVAVEVEPIRVPEADKKIAPPSGQHESEGWGTLESSMACLAAMLRGLGKREAGARGVLRRYLGAENFPPAQVAQENVAARGSSVAVEKKILNSKEKTLPAMFVDTAGQFDMEVAEVKRFLEQKVFPVKVENEEDEEEVGASTSSGAEVVEGTKVIAAAAVGSASSSKQDLDVVEQKTGSFVVVRPQGRGGSDALTSFLVQVEAKKQLQGDATTANYSYNVIAQTAQSALSIEYLLLECGEHPNRFVREYAFLSLAELLPLLDTIRPALYQVLGFGLQDNWSQVKYASSRAVRRVIEHGDFVSKYQPGGPNVHNPTPGLRLLAPYMCLNRHYVAEGVRLYSQDNWKMLNPRGGIPLILACLDEIVDAYADSTNAPNHAVREAACKCILELAERVAPQSPREFSLPFNGEDRSRAQVLVAAVLSALEDESWPVRDHACLAAARLAEAFPALFEDEGGDLTRHFATSPSSGSAAPGGIASVVEDLRIGDVDGNDKAASNTTTTSSTSSKTPVTPPQSNRVRLLQLLSFAVGDNIPCLRKNAGHALSICLKLWRIEEEVFTRGLPELPPELLPAELLLEGSTFAAGQGQLQPPNVNSVSPSANMFVSLDQLLKNGGNQPMDSTSFANYTPSGPFSVPLRRREYNLGNEIKNEEKDPRFDDATMYSCGSVAPRNFKKFKDKGGCMNCTVHGLLQPWEQAEGALHTLVNVALLHHNANKNYGVDVDGEAVEVDERTPSTSGDEFDTLGFLAKRMPLVMELFTLSHFPHHCQLKQTICERLGELATAKLWSPTEDFVAKYLRPAAFEQKSHKALAYAAQGLLRRCEIR